MNKFKVYAIRYATRDAVANEHFYGSSDPHEDYSMPMDYFVWVLKSDELTIVVDAGFNEKVAKERNREFIVSPIDALSEIGIHSDDVDYVIITHLHYDHIGNLNAFQNAKFIVQERELSFWTGKYASKGQYINHVEKEDILFLVEENFSKRVVFVDGDEEILPGVTLYLVGGHSPGLQMVKINLGNESVLLTSDVSHFYENFQEERPFRIISDLPSMYDGFELVNKLSRECKHIIPGHDPKVMKLYSSLNTKHGTNIVEIK